MAMKEVRVHARDWAAARAIRFEWDSYEQQGAVGEPTLAQRVSKALQETRFLSQLGALGASDTYKKKEDGNWWDAEARAGGKGRNWPVVLHAIPDVRECFALPYEPAEKEAHSKTKSKAGGCKRGDGGKTFSVPNTVAKDGKNEKVAKAKSFTSPEAAAAAKLKISQDRAAARTVVAKLEAAAAAAAGGPAGPPPKKRKGSRATRSAAGGATAGKRAATGAPKRRRAAGTREADWGSGEETEEEEAAEAAAATDGED